MKFCPNCGTQIEDNNLICVECGVEISKKSPVIEKSIPKQMTNIEALDDNAAYRNVFLLVILGMLLPLVGVILYLIWRNSQPIKARAVGIGSLLPISFISFYFVYII